MVGSHKGSCHIFDTSGMTALLSHILTHVRLCSYSFFIFARDLYTTSDNLESSSSSYDELIFILV